MSVSAKIRPNAEVRLQGYPLSEGVALAHVVLLEAADPKAVTYYRIPKGRAEEELARVHEAVRTASAQLALIVSRVSERIGKAQSNIFVAQQMMAQDPVLLEEIATVIRTERVNAEAALVRVLDRYESLLHDVDSDYLKERASDIGEVRRRLLDILHGSEPQETLVSNMVAQGNNRYIIVAEELTPTQTVSLDPLRTAGFITERGGPASHAAILARAMGIPAVTGIADVRRVLPHGEPVLLDGTNGVVVLRPGVSTLQVYPAARRATVQHLSSVAPVEGLAVMANINLSTDVDEALEAQAEGIGLYRTEYECFMAGRLLTEEEQYERYAAVVEAMAGRPVYIRLLDLGGDKPLEFIDLPQEDNPCLGFRGARLLMGRTDLFITQARALARASQQGPIHVIYPMIADLSQFLVLRELYRQHTSDLAAGEVKHGVMFEVPSCCLMAEEMFEVADFGSIGSNDLIQYLFAVDRNNSLVAKDYSPDYPVFWSLLERLSQAASAAGKPLSLCGEMGGQPQYLPRLIDTGIRSVSMSSRLIGLARLSARQILGRSS